MLAYLLCATVLAPDDSTRSSLQLEVDRSRHEVVVTWRIDGSPADGGREHAHHAGAAGAAGEHAHIEWMERFQWPVAGWIRGARVEVRDPRGALLSQRLLHHINLVHFGRGRLVHPGAERLWGAGQESDPVMLPATVGVPVGLGADMGVIIGFAPSDLPPGSTVTMIVRWTPPNTMPRPADLLPVSISVNFRPGIPSAYDVPPGRSEASYEFVQPAGGRLVGAGGHLHDHGVELRLEVAESGRVIFALMAARDSLGKVIRVEQRLFGVWGAGKRLVAGRRYRVSAVYRNPTSSKIVDGGMATMALGFVPDRIADLPALDSEDPETRVDLARLESLERR